MGSCSLASQKHLYIIFSSICFDCSVLVGSFLFNSFIVLQLIVLLVYIPSHSKIIIILFLFLGSSREPSCITYQHIFTVTETGIFETSSWSFYILFCSQWWRHTTITQSRSQSEYKTLATSKHFSLLCSQSFPLSVCMKPSVFSTVCFVVGRWYRFCPLSLASCSTFLFLIAASNILLYFSYFIWT